MNIEELFAFPDTEHAILLTYCASLAHFERNVLRRMLSSSPGVQVELLMDASQAADSFFEAAALTAVGVDYRLTPISLRGGVFHSKLFLLVGAGQSRLIVTSANLTHFGLRDNAEIVCVADSAAGEADRALLWDAGVLLRELAESVPVGASRDRLLIASEKIQSDLGTRPASEMRLLSNLSEPLFDQVELRGIPRRISIVAPYVDGNLGSFRQIGSQFPEATLQLVTSEGSLAACDGDAVTKLSSRARAAVFTGFENPPESGRALHGKLYVFEGDGEALSLYGSPNLSQAALLRSVPQGGNFEVVIEDRVTARHLLDRVAMRDVPWSSFQRSPEGDERRTSRTDLLTALSAEAEGRCLRVDAIGDPDGQWTAQVRARTGTIDIELNIESANEHVLCLEGRSDSLLSLPDEPTVVRVAAVSQGLEKHALLWLGLSSALKRSGIERKADRLRRDLEASGEVAQEDTENLVLVLKAILASLIQPSHRTKPKPDPAPQGEEEDRALTGALVVEAPPDVSGSGATAFATPARAFSVVGQLALAFRTAESLESASESTRQLWEEGSGASESSKRRTLTKRSGSKIRDELLSAIQAWEKWPGLNIDLAAAADFTDLVLRTLPHYALRFAAEGKDDLSAELTKLQLHAIRAAFSIDGTELGRPSGWLIRAWLDDPKRVTEVLSTEDRLESLIASFGATVSISEVEAIEEATVGSDVSVVQAAAGLKLLGLASADWDRVAGHARRIASPASEIISSSSILEAARKEYRDPQLVEAARVWEPVLREYGLPPDSPDWVSMLSKRKLRELQVDEESLLCSECFIALPMAAQRARMSVQPIECQNCGCLLVPYSYRSDATQQVLSALLHGRESQR